MLITFDEAVTLINKGKPLHIAGTESLLKKLPKGNWIGGSTEYFMAPEGCRISGDVLFATQFQYDTFKITSYDVENIQSLTSDAFNNGFSVVIVPFNSAVHKEYAQNAAGFKDMFIKSIVGWVAGINIDIAEQTPIAVNGISGEICENKAVVLHLEVPAEKTVSINIINMFKQDEASPVIEFKEEGFSAEKCLIDGKEVNFADYIMQNDIDTRLPLVGDYSGTGVNTSFKSIEDDIVNFYAPVFSDIKYKIAENVSNYGEDFKKIVSGHKDADTVFSCNCILNFLFCELDGKRIDAFPGPVTFGEIAYQLVNQTLVYVTVV